MKNLITATAMAMILFLTGCETVPEDAQTSPIPFTWLRQPGITYVWMDPNSGSSYTFSVPASDSKKILVPVYVNGGGPFNLVLDTGAAHTVLSQNFFNFSGPAREIPLHGIVPGASVKGYLVSTEIRVGNRSRFSEVAIAPIDIKIGPGIQAYGLLGHDFLSNYRVVIDYPNNELYLESP